MLVTYFVNFRWLNDHLFGKELFIRFTASAFRKLPSVYVFSYFPFGFEGRMWDLIVSVPDHCLSFYFPYAWSFSDLVQYMSHDMTKPTKWLCAQRRQISLGICPVWSESSLYAQWVAKDPSFRHADSDDSDQIGRCQGWSESSLRTHAICWFCHEATYLLKNMITRPVYLSHDTRKPVFGGFCLQVRLKLACSATETS